MNAIDSNTDKRGIKKVLFTFDYELFLGIDSGQVDKCLINTTEKLLYFLKKNKFQAIFFVDTVYLCRLKEISEKFPEAKKDYDKIEKQIRKMVDEGHEVFPHIHAHWVDAVYKEKLNSWDLSNYSKYSFTTLDHSLQEKLFSASMSILREIIGSDKKLLDGYRAGGWCIQPFLSFYPFFKKYHINYEFSVVPGRSLSSPCQQYDFTRAPQKNIYHFEDDICGEKRNGRFTEFSISVLEVPKHINYINHKLNVLLFELRVKFAWPIGDGKTVQMQGIKSFDKFYTGKKRMMASLEGLDMFITPLHLRSIKKNDYWHFISHPKILSPMNLFFTGIFMRKLRRRFNVETNFRKF